MKALQTGIEIEIPFYDLDPMHIVWHGNYIKYFERARCELLRMFDYDYPQMEASGYLWPIVDLRLKYIAPARYGQKVICHAKLIEYENRIKINYTIHDKISHAKLTKGSTIQVAVRQCDQEMEYTTPDFIIEKIKRIYEKI